MSSNFSRDKIAKMLHDIWLNTARDQMTQLLENDARKLREIIQQAREYVQKGDTAKAVQGLTEKFKPATDQNENGETADIEVPEWLGSLHEIPSEVPQVVVLEQQEDRFKGSSSDSLMINSGKLLKRTVRAVGHGWVGAGNGFRKIVNSKLRKPGAWKQQIPLKNVINFYLIDLSSWVSGWKNEFEKVEAELLLEADAWLLHSSGLIHHEETEEAEGETVSEDYTPNPEDIEIFLQKAEGHVSQVEAVAADQLLANINSIADEVHRAVQITDTIERPKTEYSDAKLEEKGGVTAKKARSEAAVWDTLQRALVNRVLLTTEFKKLFKQTNERTAGFIQSTEQFFDSNIIDHQQVLLEYLEEAINLFEASKSQSLKKVKELSIVHQEKMNSFIDEKVLKPLREHTEQATLSTKLERFTSALPEWTKELPEKAFLVEKLDLGQLPPVYEFEKVDWQMLVQRVLSNHMVNDLKPKEIKPEQFLQEVTRELQEIAQIIYTNLEIADEVQKSDEEEPIEVAKLGLQRAKAKLEEHQQKVVEWKEQLTNKLNEKQQAAFSKLATLLEKQDVSEVRMAGAEYKARETAVDWKTKVQALWARFSEKVELFTRFIWKKLKDYFHTVQRFLGFGENEQVAGDKTDLATFLSETDEQIARLPFIYRRLFDFKKEVDERFYIRRPEQFDRFKKGYELWQNEFPSSLALVGEKGSGKSLFIEIMKEEVITKHEVIEINFTDTIWTGHDLLEKLCKGLKLKEVNDIEELIAAIRRKKKRRVVILENIQNCYIRSISGFEAMEQMLYLISETNDEILWMSSCTRYAWLFFDKVLNISDYFTHTAETDKLDAEQIRELILKRHRASGYQLKFLPDEAIKKSRSFRKVMDSEEDTQEYLRSRYFEKMAKMTEGNASIAMIFWIRSIHEFDDSYFYIMPFDFASINRIDELESPELFVLAAFILHDSLMPEELARIMHYSLPESKLMVSRLNSRSILYRSEDGYMLNHLIYRQVVRVLKEANYIH